MEIISIGSRCPDDLSSAARESSSFSDCFDLCKPLSFHAECFVSLAKVRCSGLTVVVKSWYKDKLDALQRFQVDNECRIHSSLSHPTVLPALIALETCRNIYLVVEYADGGDLRAHLQQHGLGERQVRDFIVAPLLQALTLLEKEGIVHRDLKPDNVLVNKGEVCLADFGLSMLMGPAPPAAHQSHHGSSQLLRHVLEHNSCSDSDLLSLATCDDTESMHSSSCYHGGGAGSRSQSGSSIQSDGSMFGSVGALLAAGNAGGTPLYASPEVLLAMFKNQPPQQAISPKNDVWALGIMALEALTGSHPFSPSEDHGQHGHHHHHHGYHGHHYHHHHHHHHHHDGGNLLYSIAHHTKINMPACLSPEVRDFLEQALRRDPSARPPASQLLQHPWLSRCYAPGSSGGAAEGYGYHHHHPSRIEEEVECWEY